MVHFHGPKYSPSGSNNSRNRLTSTVWAAGLASISTATHASQQRMDFLRTSDVPQLSTPPPPGDPPPFLYRSGTKGDSNLNPRPADNGMLSTRDSLSNPWPLEPGQQPPLRLGQP